MLGGFGSPMQIMMARCFLGNLINAGGLPETGKTPFKLTAELAVMIKVVMKLDDEEPTFRKYLADNRWPSSLVWLRLMSEA